MSENLGTVVVGTMVRKFFNTKSQASAPITILGAVVKVYKDGDPTTETTTGVAIAIDFDAVTGLHLVTADTAISPPFVSGSTYAIVLTAGTVDGISVAGTELATFALAAQAPFVPAPQTSLAATDGSVSFLNLAAELSGTLPGLSPILCETYITRAWQDICSARLWSFLLRSAAVPLPVQVVAGTVTATQFSTTIACDTAASAALTPLLTATPPLIGRQIRLQGRSLYTITAATGSPLVLTIDRAYQELSGSGQAYQVYQAYITVPATDFLRWSSLNDYVNGYAITADRLMRNRDEFDRRDPQRQSQGLTYFLGQFTSAPSPLWEFWPHPTSGQTFIANYRAKRTVADFTDETSAIPDHIPAGLVMTRALGWYGYPWVEANKGGFPRYARQNLILLIRDAKAQYQILLTDAKRLDDEMGLQTVYNRGVRGRGFHESSSGLMGPADAKFWQGHPITW